MRQDKRRAARTLDRDPAIPKQADLCAIRVEAFPAPNRSTARDPHAEFRRAGVASRQYFGWGQASDPQSVDAWDTRLVWRARLGRGLRRGFIDHSHAHDDAGASPPA